MITSNPKFNLKSYLKNDLPAGLVVFLVALPLCLGVALASTGNPELLFSGIIAGVVGGVVVGWLSGSALGVSGPAAGLVVIIFSAIESLGSYEAFLLAVVFAGLLQLMMGYLKAGIFGYYFPSSVIKGMLAAIGIILILKEIPHALGFDEDQMRNMVLMQNADTNFLTDMRNALVYSSPGAILITILSLAILMIFETKKVKSMGFVKFLPGALVVVMVGILLNQIFSMVAPQWQLVDEHLVTLPVADSIQSFWSFFHQPDFSAWSNPQVYMVGFTIAIVASIETLLSVEATDKLDPYKRLTDANRELRAQGVGNLVAGLLGGLPITQVIVRSSANIDSGGRSKYSTITHGIILLLAVIFLPKFLNFIPLASLAAILLMIGYKLAKPALFKQMYRADKAEFFVFFATILAIVTTDLLKGIGIGLLIALFHILRRNYQNAANMVQEGGTAENPVFRLILSQEATILNKASISRSLDTLPPNSEITIDGSKSFYISADVIEIIHEFKDFNAPEKNIKVNLLGIRDMAVIGGH